MKSRRRIYLPLVLNPGHSWFLRNAVPSVTARKALLRTCQVAQSVSFAQPYSDRQEAVPGMLLDTEVWGNKSQQHVAWFRCIHTSLLYLTSKLTSVTPTCLVSCLVSTVVAVGTLIKMSGIYFLTWIILKEPPGQVNGTLQSWGRRLYLWVTLPLLTAVPCAAGCRGSGIKLTLSSKLINSLWAGEMLLYKLFSKIVSKNQCNSYATWRNSVR